MFGLKLRSLPNRLPKLILSVLALSWGLAAAAAFAVEIDGSKYAAVAFSTSTGEYGYAWNCATRDSAESQALAKCKAADAKIVGWVQSGWLALVIGDNNGYGVGWQYGNGASVNQSTRRALNECLKHSTKIRAVVRICSGDYDPVVVTWNPAVDPSKIHFDD